MSKPVILVGGGGHASVLLDMLLKQGRDIIGYAAPSRSYGHAIFDSILWLKDEDVASYSPSHVELVNGIGSLPGQNLRAGIFRSFKTEGYFFASVISDDAIRSGFAELAEGVQVFPGAIVNAGVKIGENTIVNSGAIVEHDCEVGGDCHIAPGATLSGGVKIGSVCHIGVGAVITQGLSVGAESVVGAGAVVHRSHPAHSMLMGIPAKHRGNL